MRDTTHTYTRGRTPRAVREAQMVAAAERLFSERGYHGVSMDEIAAASGISKPMLYEYFGSKEGLFLACVERARGRLFEEIARAVRGRDDSERALRAGVEAFLAFAEQQRDDLGRAVRRGRELQRGGGRDPRRAGRPDRPAPARAAGLGAASRTPSELDAIAHIFVGAAEAIAFWAVDRPEVPLKRVADHLMAVLWPVVRELPKRATLSS